MTTNYKPAKGTKGYLQSTGDGTFYFRVYEESVDKFTDYKLWHCELEVEILDNDAFFYQLEGGKSKVLDHSPETLGRL